MKKAKKYRNEPVEQVLEGMHGEPGVGKWQVVRCIKWYIKQHDCEHLLRVAAFTGKAANLIGGRTLHSALNLMVWDSRTSKTAGYMFEAASRTAK